jgi:hypothetical protein
MGMDIALFAVFMVLSVVVSMLLAGGVIWLGTEVLADLANERRYGRLVG